MLDVGTERANNNIQNSKQCFLFVRVYDVHLASYMGCGWGEGLTINSIISLDSFLDIVINNSHWIGKIVKNFNRYTKTFQDKFPFLIWAIKPYSVGEQ